MAVDSGWRLVNGNPVGVVAPNTTGGPTGRNGTLYTWLDHEPPLWVKTSGLPNDNTGWVPVALSGGQPVEGAAPVFIDDDITYLTTDNIASFPTADIDVRFTVRPTVLAAGSNQCIIAQTDSGTSDRSFYVYLTTTGRLAVNLSSNKSTYTTMSASTPIPGSGNMVWITCRVTVAVNSAGNTVATFYTSPDRGTTWTQYQQVTVATIGAIAQSAQPLYVATSDLSGGIKQFAFFGAIAWVELRDGIGGTVKAVVDYRTGWGDGDDPVGNHWTLTGGIDTWALNPAIGGGGSVDLSGLMSNSLTVTAPGAAVGYWGAAHLNFSALAAGTDPEPLYVETKRAGTYYRAFWLNENGSPRGASVNDEPGLKIFGPAGNTSYTGLITQVLNRWSGSGSQVHVWGVHTDGRYRIGSGLTPSAPCIVLAASDPVPSGIPVGTLIFRTP